MNGVSRAGVVVATVLSAAAFVAGGLAAGVLLPYLGAAGAFAGPDNGGCAWCQALAVFGVDAPLGARHQAAHWAAGAACACGVWAAWAWSAARGRAERAGEEHGSARWGTVREGRRFMDRSDFSNNIIFTERFGLAMSRPDHDPRYERNRNVLVVGGSGSGKTRGYVEPNIMQMNADYVVTDPKGESLPRMGRMLEAAGYEVLAFDTVDFSKSLRYNPMAYIADEAGVLEFVACLIANTNGDSARGNDPFWENAERLLYVALAGYLVFHCPEADRSLSGLVTLLSLAGAREDDEGWMSPLDVLFWEIESGCRYVAVGSGAGDAPLGAWHRADGGACAAGCQAPGGAAGDAPRGARHQVVRKSVAAGGLRRVRVAEPVAVEDDFALLHYKMFKDAAGKTLKSILISCNVRMEPFAIPQVRELVSADELGLERFGEGGCKLALFLVMSDTSPLYSFLHAILVWQAVNLMCARALKEHGGALPRPVHLVLDEFANIGKLPDVEKMAAVIRSRNVSMSVVLQSLSQLKARYKDDAATIVDCCDTTLFLGGKSLDTVKEVSELIGKQTVGTVTYNESRGSSASSTRNWNTVERDLLQAAEVARLPRDEAVVLIAGAAPLRDRKYDIARHPMWAQAYPGHPGAEFAEPYDFGERVAALRGG